MKAFFVFGLGMLVASCATEKQTYLPDGASGYSIECSGTMVSWGKCYEKAGKICGARGYEVVAGGAERGAVVSATQSGLFGGSTANRNMLIKCK